MDFKEKQFQEMYLSLGGKQSELEKEDGEYTHSNSQMAWEIWKVKAQVPEGFVLVPKTITDEWMSPFVVRLVCDYVEEYKGLPFEVKDSEIPGIEENYRWPIRQAHEKLMKVIEAQEQGQ